MGEPLPIQDRGPDSADWVPPFDFGEARERERELAEEAPTGVEAIGDEEEDTEPFVLMLDPKDIADGEPALTFEWVLT